MYNDSIIKLLDWKIRDSIQFNITATDPVGMSCQQILNVEVMYNVAYIYGRLFEILLLVVTALGVFKYRDEIFEFSFKNKYQYLRRDKVKVG